MRLVLTFHTVHVRSRNRDPIQKHRLRHAVVRAGIVRRHAALVTPENVHGFPRDIFFKIGAAEQLEHGFRRLATGQRDREAAVVSDRGVRTGLELDGRLGRERGRIIEESDVALGHEIALRKDASNMGSESKLSKQPSRSCASVSVEAPKSQRRKALPSREDACASIPIGAARLTSKSEDLFVLDVSVTATIRPDSNPPERFPAATLLCSCSRGNLLRSQPAINSARAEGGSSSRSPAKVIAHRSMPGSSASISRSSKQVATAARHGAVLCQFRSRTLARVPASRRRSRRALIAAGPCPRPLDTAFASPPA